MLVLFHIRHLQSPFSERNFSQYSTQDISKTVGSAKDKRWEIQDCIKDSIKQLDTQFCCGISCTVRVPQCLAMAKEDQPGFDRWKRNTAQEGEICDPQFQQETRACDTAPALNLETLGGKASWL